MSDHSQRHDHAITQRRNDEDFITLIGASVDEITRAFHARGLAEQDYAIVHRIGRHRFAMVEEGAEGALFDDRSLVAATFVRRAAN